MTAGAAISNMLAAVMAAIVNIIVALAVAALVFGVSFYVAQRWNDHWSVFSPLLVPAVTICLMRVSSDSSVCKAVAVVGLSLLVVSTVIIHMSGLFHGTWFFMRPSRGESSPKA